MVYLSRSVDGVCNGVFHKAVQRCLTAHGGDHSSLVQLRRDTHVKATLIRLFRLGSFCFTQGEIIVDRAVKYHLGARGLRSIMESIMTDLMFDLPSQPKGSTFTITPDIANKKLI